MEISEPRGGWILPVMLVSRTGLFAASQGVIALVLLAMGTAAPWSRAAAWWPFTATLTNLVSLALLVRLLKREGSSLRKLYAFRRWAVGRDVLLTLGAVVISVPLVLVPNFFAGNLLFGSAERAAEIMFRPLPLPAIIVAMALFPLTIALAELPTYFGYISPRLEKRTGKPWAAVGLAAFWLAAQHITLPFIFDYRFMLWRLIMYLPFAVFLGIVLRWRSRLLPYLMIVHGLLDLQAMITLLTMTR
jgi:hypothetical protein